ncbi:unnamed protein product [Paramecium primaurelia]|uniref:Uncharacterized protein n=1 Tax=Paramecium primaurelia TaxID=5886 RepID=A0A8S1KRR1_PARPR|nr:unnamed protein product [Paramecium primaurelia]
MKQRLNKSSILVELENNRKNQSLEEDKKINLIKERIRREKIALQNKDNQLKQIQEQLHRQMLSSKKNLFQPINFSSILLHQQQYDSNKIVKEIERQSKKKSVPLLGFKKSDTYLKLLHDQQEEHLKQITKRQQIKSRKYAQQKYSEIVKEIYSRPVSKTFHEDPSVAYLSIQKSKPISLHEQSNKTSSEGSQLLSIDKYLITKLEKILQTEEKPEENKKKQIKLKLRDQQIQKLSPIPQIKCKKKEQAKGIYIHKKVQEVQPSEWRNIVDDSLLSSQDRVQKTLDIIKHLNCQAQKIEEEINVKINVEKEQKLNDLLINQIQARLALLDNFN